MLVIRLQRRGRKGLAQYRIVVQDKRTHPSKEKVVARLGSYDPHAKVLTLDKDLAQKYLDNGAQPSERIARILKTGGVKLPKWVADTLKKEGKTRNLEKLRKNQPQEEPSTEEVDEDSEEKIEEPAEDTKDDTEGTSEEPSQDTSTEA